MKKELEKITYKISPLIDAIKRYRITLFIVLFFGIYVFLVLQISSYTSQEPDPAALAAQQQVTKRLTIDQDSIDRILELEEQDIEVKTLFEQARQNPFNE